jgi:hypothetical protein
LPVATGLTDGDAEAEVFGLRELVGVVGETGALQPTLMASAMLRAIPRQERTFIRAPKVDKSFIPERTDRALAYVKLLRRSSWGAA